MSISEGPLSEVLLYYTHTNRTTGCNPGWLG